MMPQTETSIFFLTAQETAQEKVTDRENIITFYKKVLCQR